VRNETRIQRNRAFAATISAGVWSSILILTLDTCAGARLAQAQDTPAPPTQYSQFANDHSPMGPHGSKSDTSSRWIILPTPESLQRQLAIPAAILADACVDEIETNGKKP
jgi:hypothetical protein